MFQYGLNAFIATAASVSAMTVVTEVCTQCAWYPWLFVIRFITILHFLVVADDPALQVERTKG